jgi:hypothetical protein
MRNKLIAVILALCVAPYIRAQNPIADSLELYDYILPQEKVYIHFDNNSYLPGQDIGYKAYLMNGPAVSRISYHLYINWYDEQGNLIKTQVSPVVMSSAFGTFTIPENYKQERIHMVAYTQWMLNSDTAFLFKKTLPVIQQTVTEQVNAKPFRQYQFSLLPEGGQLISGLTGNIAFKATSADGTPVPVSGIILNQRKDTMLRFTSIHDGMGQFQFIPAKGEIYTCSWWGPDSIVQHIQVPAAQDEGISIRVAPTGAIREAIIEFSRNIPEKLRKLQLLITFNQQIVYQGRLILGNENPIRLSLPLNRIPAGTAVLTLLDANNIPVLERLLFVSNDNHLLDVAIHTDTLSFDKRGLNVYELLMPDSVMANMSLSVTTSDVPEKDSTNINTHLLLSSELKGYVHAPMYYFDQHNDSARSHLDLVMLTNGWRRIKWEQALHPSAIKLRYSRDTGYLGIVGKLEGVNTRRITKAENINLIIKGKDSSMQTFFPQLSENGEFSQNNVIIYDTAVVHYKLNSVGHLSGNHRISIQTNLLKDPVSHQYPFTATLSVYDSTYLQTLRQVYLEQARLEALARSATLQEVVVKTVKKSRLEQMDDTYTSGVFKSLNAVSFDVVNDKRTPSSNNIFDLIMNRVSGLKVSNNVRNPGASWSYGPVSFFLDELPIDAATIASYPLNNIAYIKVIRPPFIGASTIGGGAIAIYSKKGDDLTVNIKGMDTLSLVGYTMVKEFYQPDYSKTDEASFKYDNRRTLLWLPNIITNGAEKNIKVSFYNNDNAKKFLITLEGVNDEGKLISIRKLLQE